MLSLAITFFIFALAALLLGYTELGPLTLNLIRITVPFFLLASIILMVADVLVRIIAV